MNYPDIDPVLFQIGPLAIRWYGLMYLIGFACAYFLLRHRASRSDVWSRRDVEDLVFYPVVTS